MEKIETGFKCLNWIKPKGRKGIYLACLAYLNYSCYHCQQFSSSFPSLSPTTIISCSMPMIMGATLLLRTIFSENSGFLCQLLNSYHSAFHYTQLQGKNEKRIICPHYYFKEQFSHSCHKLLYQLLVGLLRLYLYTLLFVSVSHLTRYVLTQNFSLYVPHQNMFHTST